MENVLNTREPPVIPVETTHHITDHVTSSETQLLTEHQSSGHSVLMSIMQDRHNMEELNDKVSTQISLSNKPMESVNQGEEIVNKEKQFLQFLHLKDSLMTKFISLDPHPVVQRMEP